MGICQTRKSIEELIHSKYALARDLQTTASNQFYHIYIWKYTADNLQTKQLRFYDSEHQFTKNDNLKKSQSGQDEQEQFAVSQCVEWPGKFHSDEGYIILAIRNNKKHFSQLTSRIKPSSGTDAIKQTESFYDNIRQKKVPIELLELFYMIHLDSFKPYYFVDLTDHNSRQTKDFDGFIEVVKGDLVEKVDGLKLVAMANELQRYLKRGQQNILKKLYNQYEKITVLDQNNCGQSNSPNIPSPLIPSNLNSSPWLQLQRIFHNEIRKITYSENYTQEQKKHSINKLFHDLYININRFYTFRATVLFDLHIRNDDQQLLLEKKSSSKHQMTSKKLQTSNNTQNCLKRNPNAFRLNKQFTQQLFTKSVPNQLIYIVTHNKNLPASHQPNKSHSKPYDLQDFNNMQQDISIIQKPDNLKNQGKKTHKPESQDLDTSSPFVCQITEIGGNNFNQQDQIPFNPTNNFNKKNNPKNEQIILKNGDIDQSLFLPKQLQQLQVQKTLYKLCPIPQLPPLPLYLTTYPGSSLYQQLSSRSTSLIINLSPFECYNYFIHDIKYEWFYLEPIHKLLNIEEDLLSKDMNQIPGIQQDNLYMYSIESVLFNIIQIIDRQVLAIAENLQKKNSICLFCTHKNLIYSGTVLMAYLLLSNLYRYRISHVSRLPFEQAYNIIKSSTNNKFFLPKVYETQLRTILTRIDACSSTANLNSLNTKSSSYNAYEIGLYSKKDPTLITARYIGQLQSSNQLQLLSNSHLKTYLLIPNNLTSIIIKTINILREDSSLLSSNNQAEKLGNISKLIKNMGLTLRFFSGKEVSIECKQAYFAFVKDQLLNQLVKYEYVNFPKKIFNVQKYTAKIDLIIDALKQLLAQESVQKSFRKPQPLQLVSPYLPNDIELLKLIPSSQLRPSPFTPRQTLTFKYPILRPIFQTKKKDSYYFMIKKFYDEEQKKMGCNVTFYKGENWIGLQQDKERYFEKIVDEYLQDVSEERIWIEDNDDSAVQKSLFDRDSILF